MDIGKARGKETRERESEREMMLEDRLWTSNFNAKDCHGIPESTVSNGASDSGMHAVCTFYRSSGSIAFVISEQ